MVFNLDDDVVIIVEKNQKMLEKIVEGKRKGKIDEEEKSLDKRNSYFFKNNIIHSSFI